MIKLNVTVNGEQHHLEVVESIRLLDLIRDVLGLTGTKEGCSIGECGACTVLLNGKAVCSCLILAGQVNNAEIETIEYSEKDRVLKTLNDHFLKSGAVQCGFCTPGMIISAKGLLINNPDPDEEAIRTALEGNLCRCTGYVQIIEAIQNAAKELMKN